MNVRIGGYHLATTSSHPSRRAVICSGSGCARRRPRRCAGLAMNLFDLRGRVGLVRLTPRLERFHSEEAAEAELLA